MLGALEDRADARQQVARAPTPRFAAQAGRESGRRLQAAAAGRSSPARVSAERRLADPVGSGDREDAAARRRGRRRRAAPATRHPRDVEVDGVEQRIAPARPPARGACHGTSSGTQTPAARELGAARPEHLVGAPVGEEPAVAPSTTMRSTTGSHTVDAVLDHDEGRAGLARRLRTASRTSRTPAGSRFAVGSSSRRGPGASPAPRPARVAAAARPRAPPWRDRAGVEPDRVERGRARAARSRRAGRRGSRSPNATSSPTRAITTWASGSCSTRPARPRAADAGRPSTSSSSERLALVVAAEHARQPVQQRRLARARRAEQQHPLARPDVEVEVAHGPARAARRGASPSPAP